MDRPTTITADFAWTDTGWSANPTLGHRDGAWVTADEAATPRRLGRWLLPGLANVHSHAFQRLMAGRAERQGDPQDSFWTWRELMYQFAGQLDPDGLRAVATQLYAEMLCAGYTSVCEFHYLHHAPDGRAYDDPAAMSLALVEAAREAGIGLTLLPVLYQRGGFDDRPLAARQQRFHHEVDGFVRLLERLAPMQDDGLRLGLAFHSLRAVSETAMREVLNAAAGIDPTLPVHLHIAEQTGEVDDCLARHGERPVEWLLRRFAVDRRWTLVHATHLSDAETRALAASGATVALCPTTEANLGDGLFPLPGYLSAGGTIGIGSDSQVSVSVVEELRWLEYGQRLAGRRRNVAALAPGESVGERLFSAVLAGGAAASGRPLHGLHLEPEQPRSADWVLLDDAAVELAGATTGDALDRWIFGSRGNLVDEVAVGGRVRVAGGRHLQAENFAADYRRVLATLD